MSDIVERIVEATIVHPGDTLVIAAEVASLDQLNQLADHVRSKVDDNIRVLVIAGSVQLYVLRSGEVAE